MRTADYSGEGSILTDGQKFDILSKHLIFSENLIIRFTICRSSVNWLLLPPDLFRLQPGCFGQVEALTVNFKLLIESKL
jgi:hypothetical protein